MSDSWWDSRTRPCLNSVAITSMNLFQETTESSTTTTSGGGGHRGGGGAVFDDNTSLRMMELGLSSQPISQSLDWNQALYRGDQRNDHQSDYQTLIQDDHGLSSNSSNFQENQWKSHKMYSNSPSEFKQINVRRCCLDEQVHNRDESRLNPGLIQSMDHSYGSNSTIIQSLFGSDSNTSLQQDSGYDQNQGISYSYPSGYGGMNLSGGGSGGGEYTPPLLQQEFSTNSPPKVQPTNIATQLQFSNNARFWNASAASMNDIRSSFYPLQMQSPSSTIEDKPKNPTSEMAKRSNTKSSSTKRPRNENPPMPPLKVTKVKMGDRITALQQLVSPFGKTDTASVLSEAILYIKFLHEQVNVLSTPYMKNAAITQQQQQQVSEKPSEGSRQDLRTRGLCLVPISSTFPMTHETTVDFWTPSFGGTFR